MDQGKADGKSTGELIAGMSGELIAGMSEDGRSMLERMHTWADFKVSTADGFEFNLHKTTLTQESQMLG